MGTRDARFVPVIAFALGVMIVAGLPDAQGAASDPGPASRPAGTAPASASMPRPGDALTLDPVIVTAEKRPEDVQDVPEPVTVVTARTIEQAGIRDVQEAGRYVPNLTYSHFTARRLSFPFIRGIGSGRNAPAVSTYVDGVPQLSFATANQELLDVERIEFLRGPQGTLYGRNTLGGVVSVYTRRPTNDWTMDAEASWGSNQLQDYRMTASGPIIKDQLYLSIGGGFLSRDGYTINTLNGDDVDNREGEFGRAQLLWTPSKEWEIRFAIGGERDRDGGFALYDLASVRRTPHRIQNDYEGYTHRDVAQPSIVASYSGRDIDFVSITAYQWWQSKEKTDLDATAADLIRRKNEERQDGFYQEFRFSNAKDKPLVLGKDARLSWMVGAVAFTADYDQDAGNEFRPSAAPLFGLPGPLTNFEKASLYDCGGGVFGQATLTLWDKLDLTAGLRYDYQHSRAELRNYSSLAPSFGTRTKDEESFDQVSPRFAVAYHFTQDVMAYGSIAKGYKAGGFSPQAPAGQESYGDETSWNYEAGVKTSWFNNRLVLNATAFYIDWQDLQLDTPTGVPAQFYIANAGKAYSRGVEIELIARPMEGLDLFAGFGCVDAQFGAGSRSQGTDVSGNDLPFAPNFTWNAGAQYTLKINKDLRAYARAEIFGTGRYQYDASNNASQDAYYIANFRIGVAGNHWRLEAWMRNAFDEEYVPIAFPFQLAQSGYVGEAGEPQVFGLTLGFSY